MILRAETVQEDEQDTLVHDGRGSWHKYSAQPVLLLTVTMVKKVRILIMKTANPDIKDNKNICENKSEFSFIITISTQNQKCIVIIILIMLIKLW